MAEKFFTLSYKECCPLLVAELSGTFRELDIPEIAREVSEVCRRDRCQAVLIDARAQRAPAYPATEYVFVRYRIANAVGKSWRLSVPLAIIVSEDRFVPDYLFQTVCSFHGLRARAFTDMRQAKAWLGSFIPVLHPSLALHAQT